MKEMLISYALPLGFACLLHERTRSRKRQLQPSMTSEQQTAMSSTSESGATAVERPVPLPAYKDALRANTAIIATSTSDDQLKWLLLQLCLIQIAIGSGIWEKAFNILAVKVVRGGHTVSKHALKILLRPLFTLARCLRRANQGQVAPELLAPAAADELPGAAAAGPASTSDIEGSAPYARPHHIVIISRPNLHGLSSTSSLEARGGLTVPSVHAPGSSADAQNVAVARNATPAPSNPSAGSAWAAVVMHCEPHPSATHACSPSMEAPCSFGVSDTGGRHELTPSAPVQDANASGLQAGRPRNTAAKSSLSAAFAKLSEANTSAISPATAAKPTAVDISMDAGSAHDNHVLERTPSEPHTLELTAQAPALLVSMTPQDLMSAAEAVDSGPDTSRPSSHKPAPLESANPRDLALEAVVPAVLGLPLSVALEVLQRLDADGSRVLRSVSRGLYFEASRHIKHLTVEHSNLETLIKMPMHEVFLSLTSLTFRSNPPIPANIGVAQQHERPPLDPAHLSILFKESLPHLRFLSRVDLTEAAIHTDPQLWQDFVQGLPKDQAVQVLLREPSSWWSPSTLLSGMPGEARDNKDHVPVLLEGIKQLKVAQPLATVDLQGANLRKHTVVRLSQLCQHSCIQHLTLFGKSAIAVPHGHRLAAHLGCLTSLQHLVSLELLSYEDVSDGELAPLAGCSSLRHLYVDSLFVKMATGPVFPSVTSLTAARIKFILRPLTTIFPNLTKLRLGVLYSELNKKINSASMSCLAGCSEKLEELVVCPVLWKGQWQVLPTLPGLRRLSLVHCRDLGNLREVLMVVGRTPMLELLELQACSPLVTPWPGAAAAAGPAAAVPPLPAVGNIAPQQALAAAAAAADNAGGEASGNDAEALGPLEAGTNVFSGLSSCQYLRVLVIHDCSAELVRHLSVASLPRLKQLHLQKLGSALRLQEMHAAVINLPSLGFLSVEGSADSISASQLEQLPFVLNRPSLTVNWKSVCTAPSLYMTRGFSGAVAGAGSWHN